MRMDGIIIIDKPAGWTSNDVAAKLRGAFKEKRIGYSGTLDPMATGVLPMFAGRATRAVEFFSGDDKEYVAGLRLGIVTDTQDVTGNVLQTSEASVTAVEISAVLPAFMGAQKQIPPMYSAIKIGGKKLYEMARRGVEVPRPARDIVVSEIELLGGDIRDSAGPEFLLRIVCSKGTYVRTLCHDIGAALGCGGVMSSLRRTRAGSFTVDMAHPLDEVLDAITSGSAARFVMPVDSVFSRYPDAAITQADVIKCKNGAPCGAGDLADGTYRFYGPDNEFIMLGEVNAGIAKAIKSFWAPET